MYILLFGFIIYGCSFSPISSWKSPQDKKLNLRKLQKFVIFGERPSWLNRPNEIVIEKTISDTYPDDMDALFDNIYKSESDVDDQTHSISQYTVREVSEAYGFSLAYLGDFLVQVGCKPPLDIDAKLANLLNGEAIYTLLQALTSLDPFDSNSSYDSVTVEELADELDLPLQTLINICDKESFNLPFGLDTLLHNSVADKIRQMKSYEEYTDTVVDNFVDAEFDPPGDAVDDTSPVNFEDL